MRCEPSKLKFLFPQGPSSEGLRRKKKLKVMDSRLWRVFGAKLDTMSDKEIAAAEAVLDFERAFGPIYGKQLKYPARETKLAMSETIREEFDFSVDDVMNAGRQRFFAYVRFAALSIFSELTGLSDSEVTRYLCPRRDRADVLYARKKSKELMPYSDFKDKYTAIYDGVISRLIQWNIQQ